MKIGLDIDGVLCNFVQGVFDHARLVGAGHLFPESWLDAKHWYLSHEVSKDAYMSRIHPTLKDNNLFWWRLKPLPYSTPLDFVPARYVTARMNVTVDITRQWLLSNGFPDAEVISVDSPEDKYEHVKDLDMFIDDHWETVRDLRSKGVNAVLYAAPWQVGHDVSDLPCIKHLSEVKEYVRYKDTNYYCRETGRS